MISDNRGRGVWQFLILADGGVYRRALATPVPVINHNITCKGAPGFARVC